MEILRNQTFASEDAIKEKLQTGHGVVAYKVGGKVIAWGDSGDLSHPYFKRQLATNMAGAKHSYGDDAILVVKTEEK